MKILYCFAIVFAVALVVQINGQKADDSQAPGQVANQDPVPAKNQEPTQNASQGAVQTANQDSIEAAKQDPVQTVNQGPAQTANQDSIQAANQSQVQAGNQGPAQTANQESVQTENQSTIQTANQGPAQTANQSAPAQTANQDSVQAANQSPVQTANQSAVQTGNKGPVQTENQGPVPSENQGPVPSANKNPDQNASQSVPAKTANQGETVNPGKTVNQTQAQDVNPVPAQNQGQDTAPIPSASANQTKQGQDTAPIPTASANQTKPAPDQVPSGNQTQLPAEPVKIKLHSLAEICDICNCSIEILQNPYYINCTYLSLNDSHAWGLIVNEVENVHLLLQHNEFKQVPVIDPCESLDAIDFSYNQIMAIAPFAFSHLPSLKQLLFSHNQLNQIAPDAFHSEDHPLLVEILDLSYNQITAIDQFAFSHLHSLKQLLFSHNQLNEIAPDAFHSKDNPSFVEILDFSHNQITSIDPFAFSHLPGLKQLLFSHNQLNRIAPDAFHSEDHPLLVEILDLSYNQITSLHNDAFNNMPKLLDLNLEGNPFNVLDSATLTTLNSLNVLQQLNLAGTGLKELSMSLINPINHLEIINLANNSLTSVPEILQHGSRLSELIISGNPINELLASSFIELGNLKVLEVSNMPNLKMIHKGTFFPLTSLTTLRCNDNPKLKVIERRAFRDENGEGPKSIETIELRNNNISTLNEDLFKHLGLQIDSLDVSDNPFYCTCHLQWLIQEGAVYMFLDNIKCAYPAALQGKSINELDFDSGEVPCPDPQEDEIVVHLNYVLTESYGFWLFVLVTGFILIISVAVWIFRTKPGLRYNILKIVTPSKVQYREDEVSTSKVRYMRQIDDDDAFNGIDIEDELYKR